MTTGCAVDGCPERATHRRMCPRHYKRLMRTGTTDTPYKSLSPAERFWTRVVKSEDPDGCWTRTRVGSEGYGSFYIGGQEIMAHRWSYEQVNGPIPDGLTIDHLCRNRACVNPSHLEPVTNRENTLRGENFIARQVKATHCPQGHPYSGENLYVDPKGWRHCRECPRTRKRAGSAAGGATTEERP